MDHLRLPQHPELSSRHVARHVQAPTLIERQAGGAETPAARRRPVARALGDVGIREDVLGRRVACERLHGDDGAVCILLEIDSHELEARRRAAVPAAVVRDEHLGVVGVELAVDGGGMREERHGGLGGFLVARVVVHRGAGGLHEPVADFERLVGEVAGLPHGEARRVAVPVVVGHSDVAHVVDLLARVVVVHVFAVAGELVTAVFYAPEPVWC